MIFDAWRYAAPSLAALLLGASLLSCEWALSATNPWWPGWLRNDWAALETATIPQVGGQVAGLIKGGYDRGEPLGVLIGSSYQVYDIDVDRLESEVRPRRRWLKLTCYAGSTCEVEQMGQLLMIHGRIRPATVVITMGVRMLARSETFRNPHLKDGVRVDPSELLSHLRSRRLRDLDRDVEALLGNGFNALFPDRLKINYRLRSRVLRSRLALLEGCGQGLPAIFAPSPTPWASGELDLPPIGAEEMAEELRYLREAGKFDPASYSPRSETSRSLVALICLARSVGAEVVIVIMPERSITRGLEPPEARRALFAALNDAFGAGAPRVIDLEDDVPDDGFFDLTHVDARGKVLATARLVGELSRDAASRGPVVTSTRSRSAGAG